jgi:hypothetical protein
MVYFAFPSKPAGKNKVPLLWAVVSCSVGVIQRLNFRFHVPNRFAWWQNKLKPVMLDDSDAGQLISMAEYTNIVQSSWPGNATQTMIDAFIRRMNNSLDTETTSSNNNTIDYVSVLTTGNAIAEGNQSAIDVCLISLVSLSFSCELNACRVMFYVCIDL